jgi:hypothetical protein
MSGIHRDDRPALTALALILVAVVFVAFFETGARHSLNGPGRNASYGEIQESAGGSSVVASTDNFEFWQDPFPQWAMAFFAFIATGTGVVGVIWLKQTLDATTAMAGQARKANEIARDTANRQLRAYVGTADISISNLAIGKAFKTSVKWTNRGQTPARVLRAFASVRATTDPENEKFFFDAGGGTSKGAIGASGFVVHEIGALSVVTDWMFTPIMDGSYNLAIGAYMIYEDVFGVTRRTVVRAMLDRRSIVDGTAGIHFCSRNNKAS